VHIFIISGMDVSEGQLHAQAALLSEKELAVHVGFETGWVPDLAFMLWREERYLPRLEIETKFSGSSTQLSRHCRATSEYYRI
jgi:hypothetical protein